ncbi:sigma-70 family RNA polymerase sigma factor [Umezawaea sp.]|uniref:RNA polymerase sigma factor n=1 Tax=Umezawaea sp. TaxID=1955258 RepID=UPI002ED037B6
MTSTRSTTTGVAASRPGEPPPSDATLWRLIGDDDHAAFTALFERHAERVWNYAYRLTASWSTAEDLLSATFLAAWRKRGDGVLVRESALPWLCTVAANLARTEWRAGRRRRRVLARLTSAADTTVTDHAEDLAARSEARDRLRLVVAAVERLPRSEREVAQLCLLGEMPVADAAALLGIAEASVRSRVSRARTKLRDLTTRTHDE